jgi:hypothetical protein
MACTENEMLLCLADKATEESKSNDSITFGRYITSNIAFEQVSGLIAFGHADGSIKIF